MGRLQPPPASILVAPLVALLVAAVPAPAQEELHLALDDAAWSALTDEPVSDDPSTCAGTRADTRTSEAARA